MTATAPNAGAEQPRRPGAWPAGCERPVPVAPRPLGAWDAAVAEYRAMTDDEKRARAICDCGCTPTNRRHRETS